MSEIPLYVCADWESRRQGSNRRYLPPPAQLAPLPPLPPCLLLVTSAPSAVERTRHITQSKDSKPDSSLGFSSELGTQVGAGQILAWAFRRVLKTSKSRSSSRRSGKLQPVQTTGVPRSLETPTPLGSPQVPRHGATVASYERGVSYERGTPVLALRAHPPGTAPRVVPRHESKQLLWGRLQTQRNTPAWSPPRLHARLNATTHARTTHTRQVLFLTGFTTNKTDLYKCTPRGDYAWR